MQAQTVPLASTQENKYSNWCATVQYGGPVQPRLEDLEEPIDRIKQKCVYWVIGKEVAPTTGQKHLQCYFQFKDRQRRTALVRMLPCWWENQLSPTVEQAADYCKKEGDFQEGGILKATVVSMEQARAKGAKRGGDANAERWKTARQLIESGNLAELDDQIFICHHSAVMGIRRSHMQPKATLDWEAGEQPNLWLYGKAGCGKSRKARQLAPDAYSKMCNKWWDGYKDQEDVIIDDFDIEHKVLCHHLKIWADRYPFVAEIKTTADMMRPKRIIVTSNWSPAEIWSDKEKDLDPILRRFKVINMSPLEGAFMVGATPTQAELVVPDTPSTPRRDTPRPRLERSVAVNPPSQAPPTFVVDLISDEEEEDA